MTRKIISLIIFLSISLILVSCARTGSDNLSSSEKLIADGIKFFNDKKYAKAIECYEKALEISPDDAVALGRIGEVYNETGDYDKAKEYLQRAINLDPRFAPAFSLLGYAYTAEGDYDKAFNYCRKSIELDSKNAQAWGRLGSVYGNTGDYDKAIECFLKAIELDPKADYAWRNLGTAHDKKGNVDKAMEYTKKSLDINPENAVALHNLGWFYYEKGNAKKGIEYIEKAIKLSPNFAPAWNNLGFIYEKLGRNQEAAKSYSRATELNPDNENYQKNREKGFFADPNLENYIDWNKVPKIASKKDFATYINNCKRNMQMIIPVVLTNGLKVDWNEFLNLNLTNLASYKVMDTDGQNTKMIYEVKDYPGTKVAYAYINRNTQRLSSDEMQLYNLAVKIVEEANKQPNPLQKELYIHDAITERATYYTEENMNNLPRFVTAIGALLDGKANCQGYSDAFYMLATMCGLNVGRMGGFSQGAGHMWNTIEFGDGKFYCVDVTWNDEYTKFNDNTACNNYIYFNAPAEVMQAYHSWETDYVPNLQETVDNRYFYCTFSKYSSSIEEGLKYLSETIGTGNQKLARVMCPYDQSYNDINTAGGYLKNLLNNTNYRGNFILNVAYLPNLPNAKYVYYTILDRK